MKGKVCPKCNFSNVQGAVCCGSCGEDISTTAITELEVKSSVYSIKNNRETDVDTSQDDSGNSIFSFDGRINRATFWGLVMSLILINVVLSAAVAVFADNGGIMLFVVIISIPLMWVAFATYVKRWHDLNKSGWMLLTLLIPFVNFLIFLYLGFAPGTAGRNKYGENNQGNI